MLTENIPGLLRGRRWQEGLPSQVISYHLVVDAKRRANMQRVMPTEGISMSTRGVCGNHCPVVSYVYCCVEHHLWQVIVFCPCSTQEEPVPSSKAAKETFNHKPEIVNDSKSLARVDVRGVQGQLLVRQKHTVAACRLAEPTSKLLGQTKRVSRVL